MIRTIRQFGIIPFFRSPVKGWSIEEQTDPAFWFYSSDELGPWDWKIDAVREGDIAYGKFIDRKAAFATREFYAHLMNWRRSIPRYRMALGERFPAKTHSDKLVKYLSPNALEAIRTAGALESKEVRESCGQQVTAYQIRTLGAKYRDILTPVVKKNVMDTVFQFLEMGTWTVVGDFKRVYRGANLEYSGWQRCSYTTPDALFASGKAGDGSPFWAKFIEAGKEDDLTVRCTPDESLQYLVDHVLELFPSERKQIESVLY